MRVLLQLFNKNKPESVNLSTKGQSREVQYLKGKLNSNRITGTSHFWVKCHHQPRQLSPSGTMPSYVTNGDLSAMRAHKLPHVRALHHILKQPQNDI